MSLFGPALRSVVGDLGVKSGFPVKNAERRVEGSRDEAMTRKDDL
jgi:hypothetical protein